MDSTSEPEISCLDEYQERMEESIVSLVDEMSHILKESYNLTIPQKCNGFLSRCLRVKDYNVDKAAKLVRNVHRSTQSLQDMLDKFRPKFYHKLYFSGTISLLRNRDYRGRQVLVSRIGKWDPKEFDFDESTAAQILLFSCAVAKSPETQRNGVVFLYDLTSFGLKHVKAMRPTRLLQLVSMMQDASPARIKGIHLIFNPRIFSVIYQMVRPFFTEKIAKRVFFHGDDLHSLHKFVNPSILPISLGGAKGELEAVDFDFINKLLQEENIHRDMKAYGIPAF